MALSNDQIVRKAVIDAQRHRVRPHNYDVKRNHKIEPAPMTMFTDRMKREGKYGDFSHEVRARMLETGEMIHEAKRKVAESWGYDPGHEVKLYRQHQENLHIDCAEMEIVNAIAEEEASKQDDAFEAALSTLPSNAPKQNELDWIQAHPAMMRSARAGKGTVILLSADDILKAPNGPCPSRSAACQLQHWVNNVSEFYKQIMSEAKKKSSEAAPAEIDLSSEDDSLDELEDLLGGFGK